MHSSPTNLKVFIAESNVYSCQIAQDALNAAGFRVAGIAHSHQEAKRLVPASDYGLLLVNIVMPEGICTDVIATSRKTHPHAKIMLIANAEDASIYSGIDAGAVGYVLKSRMAMDLVNAIRLLLAGGTPVSPQVAQSLLRAIGSKQAPPPPTKRFTTPVCGPLSERETEILKCLSQGLGFKDISISLGISVHTVNAHIKRVYKKLQVHSRETAISEAQKMKLI